MEKFKIAGTLFVKKKRENSETNCRPPSRLQNHLDA